MGWCGAVTGHSRSRAMPPFDRVHTTSYSTLIETMCLSLVTSVLWHCWLGGRKGIRPVKKLSGGVLAWLSVWSKVQTCIWHSGCHCHSLSLASVKSSYLGTQIGFTFLVPAHHGSPGKGSLNGCVCVYLLPFSRYSRYLSKVADFDPPHLILIFDPPHLHLAPS